MVLLQLKDVSFTYGTSSLSRFSRRSFAQNTVPWRASSKSSSKRFSEKNKTTLSGINLTLTESKSISLVGPNGAGKTTLLNLLGGLTYPSSGEIVRRDIDKVAFVSQVEREIGWMPITVREVLKMSGYKRRGHFKRLKADDFEKVSSAAERMEVSDLLEMQFNSLSVGERQRVRVSLAIAQEPDLLIMDEPLSGLDIPSQERIQKVAQEEKERGAAVVFTTHSLEEAAQANEVLLMDGKVVAQGDPFETLTEENLRKVYKDRLQVLSDHRLLVLDHHH